MGRREREVNWPFCSRLISNDLESNSGIHETSRHPDWQLSSPDTAVKSRGVV